VKKKSTMMEPLAYKKPKPSMSVKSTQMPSVKGLKVGSKIKFHVTGKVKGINQDYDNPNVHRAEIEIHGVKQSKGFAKHIGGVVK
jgi:hypothetical protein